MPAVIIIVSANNISIAKSKEMKIIIIFSLVVASLADSTNYTFQYSATDVIVIPFGNVVDLSSSLATSQF